MTYVSQVNFSTNEFYSQLCVDARCRFVWAVGPVDGARERNHASDARQPCERFVFRRCSCCIGRWRSPGAAIEGKRELAQFRACTSLLAFLTRLYEVF